MKKLLITSLLILLMAPLAISQQQPDILMGMVTYRLNEQVWVVQNYQAPLNADLQILPVVGSTSREIPTVEPQHYLVEIRDASAPAAQIAAMNDLIALGVKGFVLTPAPGIDASAVSAIAAQMPVVLTNRHIPGLDLPFFGVDVYELGFTLARYSSTKPYVVIGDFADPMQSEFLQGLIDGQKVSAKTDSLLGYYPVKSNEEAYEQAKLALATYPDLFGILIAAPDFAAGVAQAIKEVYGGTDKLVKLGSVGAPFGWKQLVTDKQLQAVFGWDSYQVLQNASVAVKVMLRDGVTPDDFYPDVLLNTSTGYPVHMSHPYSKDQPDRSTTWWR